MNSDQIKDKKVFVTGATGYVGRNLVHSLLKKGYIVYMLTRKESPSFLDNENIHKIMGDITDPIDLPRDMKIIYHCAGVIREPKEMEKVNVLGTQNMVNLAIKNDCALIHLSSAGIVGKTKDTIIDERTACRPQNDYEISKYQAEQIVLAGMRRGLKAHILRPVTIFGVQDNPDNLETDSFFQLLKSMRSGLYKNIGRGIYNIVHIDEVVKALQILGKTDIQADIPYGGTYIVGNAIAYKDMDRLVKNIPPAVTKKTQTVPYLVAFATALILSAGFALINKKNPLTFSRLKALTSKKVYSQKKLIENTSFKNSLPVEEYLKMVCKKYIELGLLS